MNPLTVCELNTTDVCVVDEVVGDKKIKGQFYDTGQAREHALTGPSTGTLSRKLKGVSQRLGNLEKQFGEFQDQRNNGTILRLEKLLEEERERLQRADKLEKLLRAQNSESSRK